MKPIVLISLWLLASFPMNPAYAQEKSWGSTFRNQVRAPASVEVLDTDLRRPEKWLIDTSFRLSQPAQEQEQLRRDLAKRVDYAKTYLAFQANNQVQMYVGNGRTVSGTYQIVAKANPTKSSTALEKATSEQMKKAFDERVLYQEGSPTYFLILNLNGAPNPLTFEIQIFVGVRMILYIEAQDRLTQWKAERKTATTLPKR